MKRASEEAREVVITRWSDAGGLDRQELPAFTLLHVAEAPRGVGAVVIDRGQGKDVILDGHRALGPGMLLYVPTPTIADLEPAVRNDQLVLAR
jgi:hypothetical protein